MKITIYELLGLVKDGKAHKKIKYKSVELEYEEKNEDYCYYFNRYLFEYKFTTCNGFLNDEVEIPDEEPKPITKESIEALGYACGEIRKCFENGWNKSLENKPLIEEEKKIEKLVLDYAPDIEEKIFYDNGDKPNHCIVGNAGTQLIIKKINELIDKVNKLI